jgi:PKHD-type hydroxylase
MKENMYNINEWFYFTEGLDKKTCNKIRNSAKGNWEESVVDIKEGTTDEERITGEKRILGTDKNTRISDVVWTEEQWIYDTIWPYMEGANKRAGWKYDIRGAESMQITRYKKGGFYQFHKDGRGDHLSTYDEPDNEFTHGNVRKLSLTVLLNDNYEGGEFQFATLNSEECIIDTPEFNKTGMIIVFPSDVEHRVAPVTKGIRYSLVAWFVGPPFK